MKITDTEFADAYSSDPNYNLFLRRIKIGKPVIVKSYPVESIDGLTYAGFIAEIVRLNPGKVMERYYRVFDHYLKPLDKYFENYDDAVACVLATYAPIEDEVRESIEKYEESCDPEA